MALSPPPKEKKAICFCDAWSHIFLTNILWVCRPTLNRNQEEDPTPLLPLFVCLIDSINVILGTTLNSTFSLKLGNLPMSVVHNLLIVLSDDMDCGNFIYGKSFTMKDLAIPPSWGTRHIHFQAYLIHHLFPNPFGFQTCHRPTDDWNLYDLNDLICQISEALGDFWLKHIHALLWNPKLQITAPKHINAKSLLSKINKDQAWSSTAF